MMKKKNIIALVTNSNSIIPIKSTKLTGSLKLLSKSNKKYYKNLDKWIRKKPIGILKYSEEINLNTIQKWAKKGFYEITRFIKNTNNKYVKYWLELSKIQGKNKKVLLPISKVQEENKELFHEVHDIVTVVSDGEWKLTQLVNNLQYLYDSTNKKISFRPIRIVLNKR